MPAPPVSPIFNPSSSQARGLVGCWNFFGQQLRGTYLVPNLAQRSGGIDTLAGAPPTWRGDPDLGGGWNLATSGQCISDATFSLSRGDGISMVAWVRLNTAHSFDGHQYQFVMAIPTNEMDIRFNNSVPEAYFYDGGGIRLTASGAGVVSANVPIHIASTWSEATKDLALYINGVSVGTTNFATSSWASGGTDAVVRLSEIDGNDLDGLLSEARIYNRALTAAEVWQMWAPQTRWDLYAPTIPLAVGGAPAVVVDALAGALSSSVQITASLSDIGPTARVRRSGRFGALGRFRVLSR